MLKLTSVSMLLALGPWDLLPTQQPGPTCEMGWGSPAELPREQCVLLVPLPSSLLASFSQSSLESRASRFAGMSFHCRGLYASWQQFYMWHVKDSVERESVKCCFPLFWQARFGSSEVPLLVDGAFLCTGSHVWLMPQSFLFNALWSRMVRLLIGSFCLWISLLRLWWPGMVRNNCCI